MANTVPIFKKGDRTNPGNYRPVSLTCIVAKVFESILRDVIMNYCISLIMIFLQVNNIGFYLEDHVPLSS